LASSTTGLVLFFHPHTGYIAKSRAVSDQANQFVRELHGPFLKSEQTTDNADTPRATLDQHRHFIVSSFMNSLSFDHGSPANRAALCSALGGILPAPPQRTATRIGPTFAEAWYNRGDLLDEQGRFAAAIDACARSRSYVDAMFNLALEKAADCDG
jgi:hypothetical protein